VPVGVGTLLQDSLVLVRAVASQVTAKYRGVAVWPVFVRKTGERAVGITPSDSARQRVLTNAFAEALGAPIVNLARGPDSTRAGLDSTVGTIGIVAILVQSDSAYVDVTFVPSQKEMHGEWMFTAYRYHYRRERGRWSFVRREWLGSA
jgi:hypothetical protein